MAITPKYQTSDGKLFDTPEQAAEHEEQSADIKNEVKAVMAKIETLTGVRSAGDRFVVAATILLMLTNRELFAAHFTKKKMSAKLGVVNKCENCMHCPTWNLVTERTLKTVERGLCRKPVSKGIIRELGLPPGTSVQMPWIYRNAQKMNCPGFMEFFEA